MLTRTVPLEGLNLRWPLAVAQAVQALAEASAAGAPVAGRVAGFTTPACRDVGAATLRLELDEAALRSEVNNFE